MAKKQASELQQVIEEVRRLRQSGWSFPQIEDHLKRSHDRLVSQAVAEVQQSEQTLQARQQRRPSAARGRPGEHLQPQPVGCAVVKSAPLTPA